MQILVTGGAGFIGSHIVEYFQERAHVRVLDNFSTGFKRNLDGLTCDVMEGSILDRAAVREAVSGVDYVFHLAAMISVPESMSNPVECNRINTEGTLLVLEESAGAGVKKLCFSSSAAVYGDHPTPAKKEDLRPEPRSPYAVTKLDGEYYCGMYHKEGLLDTVCMRYFNVFGPRQNPNSPYAAAVPIFTARAISGKAITIYGDGEQTRDFIYVKDVAAANAYLAASEQHGIFNVAHGQKTSIRDLAKILIEKTASSSTIEFAEERPGDIKHSMADISHLSRTGFKPRYSLKEGLDQTVAYYKEQSLHAS